MYKHVESNLQTRLSYRNLKSQNGGGDPTTWQQFYDSFTAALQNSVSLTNVEKSNCLRLLLVDEALHCISGLALTNNNCENALKLLKHRYENNQIIISAHMIALVKVTLMQI